MSKPPGINSLAPLCALSAAMLILLAGETAVSSVASRFNTVPQHTSILTGQDWVDELLAGHVTRFYNELGM